MDARRGEKIGWIGGWLGGFLWVVILAIVFLVQGKGMPGVLGLVLAAMAVLVIVAAAPWRHPDTEYWKLMIPVYVLFFLCVGWGVWTYGGASGLGLSRWSVFLLLPILTPFGTVGRQRWRDREAGPRP
jgi:hypothetical protein